MTTALRRMGGVMACAATVFAAGCSSTSTPSSSPENPPKIEQAAAIGAGEGQLNLVAWPGYAEDGSNDPKVDWVHPFEQETGCKVNVKVGNTSDEMVQLMRTGQYDGLSASGDATLRLIYAGDVAPVNTAPQELGASRTTSTLYIRRLAPQPCGMPYIWSSTEFQGLSLRNGEMVS